MREAVIVTSLRTAVGKAPRGALRHTRPDDMAAAVLSELLRRTPGLAADEIEDVILGCAMPEAEQGMNMGRISSLRAGPAPYGLRDDHQPLLLLRTAIDRHGSRAHPGRLCRCDNCRGSRIHEHGPHDRT